MAFAPSSPVTGAAVAGFTAPTYTLTPDMAPSANGKQYAVTGLGGTQTGVDINALSKPFTHTFFKPVQIKTLPSPNPVTGVIKEIPYNTWKLLSRKGIVPAANQAPQVNRIYTVIELAAGSDTYEPEEVKALISSHAGILFANASGITDTCLTGIL